MFKKPLYTGVIRILLVAGLIAAGIAHFLFPEEFIPAVPPPFENAVFWIYLTGVAEILAAIGLMIPKFRRLTSCTLVLYFIALLPAHVEMLLIDHEIFGIRGDSFMIARIFFQLVTIETEDREFTAQEFLSGEDLDSLYVTLRNSLGVSFPIDLTMLHIRQGREDERLVFVLRDDSDRRRQEEQIGRAHV